MKTLSGLVLGLLFSLTFAPQLGAAPQFGSRAQNRDRVCVYQDIRYQGWEQCYNAGDEISTLDRRNNAISSIRIYGRARVTVYDNTGFRGQAAEFSSDVPDLGLRNVNGSRSWSDHIQSLRVSSDSYSNNNSNNTPIYGGNPSNNNRYPNQQQQISQGVCVYDRPDYQGREQCWNSGSNLSDLARSGDGNWSDKISSIRLLGRTSVVLYRDIGYRGESVVIDQDIPDLARISGRGFRNWENQASSLQIENSRGNGASNRDRGFGRSRPWR